ncbi:MAG: dihydroorotase, partial [Spirochaetales bacterium]
MIDPHVHLRDWSESSKETLLHGFSTAASLGFSGVFEQPNTNPPLVSRALIEKRLLDADSALRLLPGRLFHGLYAGLTREPAQIREMAGIVREYERVVGLKLFAGFSTGNLAVPDPEDQKTVYAALAEADYRGVLAVHCEKESCFRPEMWNPAKPETHSLARPPEAETASVEDQIRFARDGAFKGTLHVCHVSVPDSLNLIEKARGRLPFALTCEITPHHALLWNDLPAGPLGPCLKVNPPLRPKALQEKMLEALLAGRITCIASDHAPHTLAEKLGRYASGMPSLVLHPVLHAVLLKLGMNGESLRRLTRDNILALFFPAGCGFE